LTLIAGPVSAQPQKPQDVDEFLAEMGAHTIRAVNIDICFPATSEEYEAVGKYAIVMLDSKSAIGTELPLKAVYLQIGEVNFPLRRIALLEKYEDDLSKSPDTNTYTRQVSFYLIPISMMKLEARLAVDFQGGRTEFGVMSFPSGNGFDGGAPAFVRLDEYDTPSEPNMDALSAMIVREYPDYFQ
tara:strand:- start:9750 stop:10304 length:555 start_codon:yes stop_codon:yes gene_type:complete